MINFKIIYKVLGSLLFIEAIMMLCCMGVSVYYHESDIWAFLVAAAIVSVVGIILKYKGFHAENSMGRRDAYLLVTLTWIVFSLFGALPFILSGSLDSYTDAFFETMSGFTTTGASIIDDVESLSRGLLFWRSMTHWIGGLGIVFFTIAVFPSLVGGSMRVFSAEATGPIKTKIHPRLSTNAKSIWVVYLLLTISCAACLYACGMNIFDSLNHSMSITATGGFSTYNDSAAHFNSVAIDYTAVTFMFLSGINFTLIYISIVKGKFKSLFNSAEFRLYTTIVLLSTAVIMFFLIKDLGYGFFSALRYALFQVVSYITTTGLFNADAGQWPHITWMVLGLCIFIGACSGSTSGGFKCIRGVMIIKIVKNEFKHIIHPRAVLPVKINGSNVPTSTHTTLLVFLTLYVFAGFCAYFIFTCIGINSTNSFTMALSCISNAGPSIGPEISPTMSWSIIPDAGKWLCSILMLMGRLEFFSVMVLFTSVFWKDN